MMARPFQVVRRSALDPTSAWRQVTTWERHGDAVPFTSVRRQPGSGPGLGERFVARTTLGPVGFDDLMEVVAWEPPREGAPTAETGRGFCRVEKRGRTLTGWTEITVQPDANGSVVTWREHAEVPRLGRLGNAPAGLVGRLLFGRLLKRLLTGTG
jgi:hypothetical protein